MAVERGWLRKKFQRPPHLPKLLEDGQPPAQPEEEEEEKGGDLAHQAQPARRLSDGTAVPAEGKPEDGAERSRLSKAAAGDSGRRPSPLTGSRADPALRRGGGGGVEREALPRSVPTESYRRPSRPSGRATRPRSRMGARAGSDCGRGRPGAPQHACAAPGFSLSPARALTQTHARAHIYTPLHGSGATSRHLHPPVSSHTHTPPTEPILGRWLFLLEEPKIERE